MKKNELLDLDEHLCFSIYATSRAIQRLYYPILAKNNLTYPQYLILVILYKKNFLSVKEIGEKLDLDSGTLTPLLKRMEKQQLVVRKRSLEDERIVNISITKFGKTTRENLIDLPKQLLEKISFNKDEWDNLFLLVNKLFNDISD